jgi:GMP synthase-like glutamine amidotransferase
MKPIAILQHDPLQHPGYLLQFLDEAGVVAHVIRPCEGDDVPCDALAFAGIVFLGSDDSVNDPFAWVEAELQLARDAVARDVPVLGHCFGGQLLARALGATVHRHPCPNIGWAGLRTTPAARPIFGSAAQVQAFNWHYESFGIPAGATRTLYGEHCLNKGFVFGPHLAFQGHFEVTEAIVRAWCSAHEDELALAGGPAAQSVQQILTCLPERVAAVHVAARAAYSSWLGSMTRHGRIHFQTA